MYSENNKIDSENNKMYSESIFAKSRPRILPVYIKEKEKDIKEKEKRYQGEFLWRYL